MPSVRPAAGALSHRALAGVCLILLAAGAGTGPPSAATAGDHPVSPVTASLVWEVPGETADYLLGGLLVAAAFGPGGDVYVVDYDSKDCKVFAGGDGRWQRTLGRAGDGPGEVRDARGLVLTDDGRLGLLQIFPATMVWLDARTGDPAGRTSWRQDPQASGGFVAMPYLVPHPDGWLAYVSAMAMRDGQAQERHWIAPAHPDGSFGAPVFHQEVAQPQPDARGRHDERDFYDIWAGRWAPDGRGGVWVAPERDRYRLVRHDADGAVVAEITREVAPRRRTPARLAVAEERAARKSPRGAPVDVHPTAPVVRGLRLAGDGRLWVDRDLAGQSPAPGTITWTDVYAADGTLVTQRRITGPFDPATDHQWRWLDDRHLLVLRATGGGEITLRLLRLAAAPGA
jgi:hypothetical protein